jgi:F-type H+-transporting ATPase subunit gamma
MRQRIRAIETIKKITHAMRLISMSNRSHLKNKEHALTTYTQTLNKIFCTLKAAAPDWHNQLLYPAENTPKKKLIILIGSQKGLCGNFNSALCKEFERYQYKHQHEPTSYLAIGKKAIDYINEYVKNHGGTVVGAYASFSFLTIITAAQIITQELFNTQGAYTQAVMFCNAPKTFFVHKPRMVSVIPFVSPESSTPYSLEYQWELPPTETLDILINQSMQAVIQNYLFQSLLAEQAARFLSMDSATRNADGLLQTTQLQYNKLRQAKITKELTELAGSL